MVLTSPKRVSNLNDAFQLNDEEYLSSRRNLDRARLNPRPSTEKKILPFQFLLDIILDHFPLLD